jgi:hypothetical protein
MAIDPQDKIKGDNLESLENPQRGDRARTVSIRSRAADVVMALTANELEPVDDIPDLPASSASRTE